MSDYRDEYGNPVRTDEYGNPIRADPYGGPVRTDKHGNPIPEKYDTGYCAGAPTGGAAAGALQSHPEKLHRSGSSSSSSSSEDDGQGGRRKKGLKEKIKEKLPGVGHKPQAEGAHYGETTVGQQQHHEKKGMMEKIKEKLPGGHHNP